MMKTNFHIIEIDFNQLPLNRSEIFKLLGYAEDKVTPDLTDILDQIIEEATPHFHIRGGYVMHDILKLDTRNGILETKDEIFNPGRTICINLKGSDEAGFYLCTAGDEVSRWTKENMTTDPLKSYIIDILASLTVDSAVDSILSRMESEQRTNITNSYNPGYCGWSLTEQKKMFKLFPDKFCGIELTPSCLMVPIKSVSGIVGSGPQARKHAYACEICDIKDCMYRNLRNRKVVQAN